MWKNPAGELNPTVDNYTDKRMFKLTTKVGNFRAFSATNFQ